MADEKQALVMKYDCCYVVRIFDIGSSNIYFPEQFFIGIIITRFLSKSHQRGRMAVGGASLGGRVASRVRKSREDIDPAHVLFSNFSSDHYPKTEES